MANKLKPPPTWVLVALSYQQAVDIIKQHHQPIWRYLIIDSPANLKRMKGLCDIDLYFPPDPIHVVETHGQKFLEDLHEEIWVIQDSGFRVRWANESRRLDFYWLYDNLPD